MSVVGGAQRDGLSNARRLNLQLESMRDVPMAGRRDKVEHGVDSIVCEARITPDARLFGEMIVVLSFKVADNLREAVMVLSVLPLTIASYS